MSDFETADKKVHQGKNIKRFREMFGIKQEALAYELGHDWTQKKISLLEQRETIEADTLELLAETLKVPVAAIENLDDEDVMNIIGNTFHDSPVGSNQENNISCTFNPIHKLVALYDEKIALYERMLQEKEEIIERMERLIKNK